MVWIPAALEVQPDPLVAKPCVVAGLWGAEVWMLASHLCSFRLEREALGQANGREIIQGCWSTTVSVGSAGAAPTGCCPGGRCRCRRLPTWTSTCWV